MKLTNLTTTLATTVKHNAVKLLAGAALAGALLCATPAAQAEQVHFGVFVGGPRFYRPAPPVFYGPRFYAPAPYGFYHRDWRYDHRGWR